MTPPSVPLSVWLLGAFDPVLVVTAVFLGWKADQPGKLFIAAMAAVALSVVAAWFVTLAGLPWPAPVGGENPTLLPVRTLAALAWAGAAYVASGRFGPRAGRG